MAPRSRLIAAAGLGLVVACATGALAQTRQALPPAPAPFTAGRPVCIRVFNTTDYWYPIKISIPGRGEPESFRVEAKESRQFCVIVALNPGERFKVELRSWIAPIGECLIPPGGQAEIVRTKDDDGDPVNRLACADKGG